MISTAIFSLAMIALSAFLFSAYLKKPDDQSLLYFGLLPAIFALLILRKSTRKFVIYPSKKTMTYSSSILSNEQSYLFDEFAGTLITGTRSMMGFKVGSALQLRFRKNGREKAITLGQNVSTKNMRTITEEISKLMKAG